MTKDKLIVKQQLELEELKTKLKQNRELFDELRWLFYGIGQPLNDNKLNFTDEQIKWCFKVYSTIKELEN